MKKMIEVKFTVPGKPVSKGRPRFRRTGEYVQTYTDKNTKDYEQSVRDCWEAGNFPKLEGPVTAKIAAFFPIPKSGSKKKKAEMNEGKIPYFGREDVDNLAQAVLDAINGHAYKDDSQVTLLVVSKGYSDDPRCEVRLFGEEVKHEESES